MIYETRELGSDQVIRFLRLFDGQVGTEREMTRHDLGMHTVTCFELQHEEVDICKEIETSIAGERS